MTSDPPRPTSTSEGVNPIHWGCALVMVGLAFVLFVCYAILRGIAGTGHHEWPSPDDDHHGRHRRSERVERALDKEADLLGSVYIRAGEMIEKGDDASEYLKEKLPAAHDRAFASIREEMKERIRGSRDKREKARAYVELGEEMQGKTR